MKQLLLPSKFRIIGYILTGVGLLSVYIRFGIGIKPEFLECRVFAVYSSFFKTVWFSIVQNNISEEICASIVLAGLFMIAFAREKAELNSYKEIRYKSIFLALYLDILFMLCSIFLIYGFGFIIALIINMFLPLLFYIIIFRISLFRESHQGKI